MSCGDVSMPEGENAYIYYANALVLQGVNQTL